MLPIHYACTCRAPLDIVRLLLDSIYGNENNHSRLSVPDSHGRLPLHCAAAEPAGETARTNADCDNAILSGEVSIRRSYS